MGGAAGGHRVVSVRHRARADVPRAPAVSAGCVPAPRGARITGAPGCEAGAQVLCCPSLAVKTGFAFSIWVNGADFGPSLLSLSVYKFWFLASFRLWCSLSPVLASFQARGHREPLCEALPQIIRVYFS